MSKVKIVRQVKGGVEMFTASLNGKILTEAYSIPGVKSQLLHLLRGVRCA